MPKIKYIKRLHIQLKKQICIKDNCLAIGKARGKQHKCLRRSDRLLSPRREVK